MLIRIRYVKIIVACMVLSSTFLLTNPTSGHSDEDSFQVTKISSWFSSPVANEPTGMTWLIEFNEITDIICLRFVVYFPKNLIGLEEEISYKGSDLLPFIYLNGSKLDESQSVFCSINKYEIVIANHMKLSQQKYVQISISEELKMHFKQAGLYPFRIDFVVATKDQEGNDRESLFISNEIPVRIFEYLP